MTYIPDHTDPARDWYHIGGDLEASYDGIRFVDIRNKFSKERLCFISRGALEQAITLFDPPPVSE